MKFFKPYYFSSAKHRIIDTQLKKVSCKSHLFSPSKTFNSTQVTSTQLQTNSAPISLSKTEATLNYSYRFATKNA